MEDTQESHRQAGAKLCPETRSPSPTQSQYPAHTSHNSVLLCASSLAPALTTVQVFFPSISALDSWGLTTAHPDTSCTRVILPRGSVLPSSLFLLAVEVKGILGPVSPRAQMRRSFMGADWGQEWVGMSEMPGFSLPES